ncbi:unnamed protein product, partial [Prorocentrum cordatum]
MWQCKHCKAQWNGATCSEVDPLRPPSQDGGGPSTDGINTKGLSAEDLQLLAAIATRQGQLDLAKQYESARAKLLQPARQPEASLHTRASQTQSKIRQVEKKLDKEISKLERWREATTMLEASIQEMADELDGHERQYSELVEQISLEVASSVQPKQSTGPIISLRDLVEGKELSFEL